MISLKRQAIKQIQVSYFVLFLCLIAFVIAKNYVYIGIHIRHGMDVTMHSVISQTIFFNTFIEIIKLGIQRNRYHGHVTAPVEYFQHAIKKARTRFSTSNLLFLVAGDDLKWTQETLRPFESHSGGRQLGILVKYREEHFLYSRRKFACCCKLDLNSLTATMSSIQLLLRVLPRLDQI